MTEQQQNRKRYFTLSRIGVMIFLLAVLLWGLALPRDVTLYTHDKLDILNQGWTQEIRGESLPLADIEQFIQTETGTPLVFTRPITADMIGENLLFYAEHQTVRITAEGRVLYQFTCSPALERFGTPGRTWVRVPLTEDLLGKTLRVELCSAFATYQGIPSTIYCLSENNIHIVQIEFLVVRNTAALIMLGLAVISYINALLWKQLALRRLLFSLADLYLLIGLWLCAEMNILAMWLGRAPLSAILGMVLARVVPIACYHFFHSTLPDTSFHMRMIGGLVWGNFIVSMVLQFVFGQSLLYFDLFNTVIIVVVCVLSIAEIFQYHLSGLQFLPYAPICYWVGILAVGGLGECYIHVHYQTCGQWMGIPISLACILYAMIAHVHLMRMHSHTAESKENLEQTFHRLQKQPLNQQINAHFLYNALNTIGAYCREDPAQAHKAITLVAQYMRAYTLLLDAQDYVSLEDELDLMETYMDIQNMRFANSIRFSVHNTCDEVLLPPLTLQPLVENAVNHGIRKRENGGEIHIATRYRYHMAEITVSDNGVGFDPKRTTAGCGVALRNLEKRIQAMGGKLTVQSKVGEGTRVTLLVPLTKPAWEESEPEEV